MSQYRLVNDDDGHWFVIEAERIGDFEEWLLDIEAGEYNDEEAFDECMIDGGPESILFSDWEEV